jgi:hypothetical protein
VPTIPTGYQTPHGLTAEIRSLILAERSTVLGTINPDGSPHMTLLLFSMDDAGRVYLPTPRSTRKIKNIRQRPSVTAFFTIDDGWASCSGIANILEGDDAAERNAAVRRRVFTEIGQATMGRYLEAHEDLTIEISPTKWLSWRTDPIIPWFAEHGIDLDEFDGPWMRDLRAEH